jgi:S-adenosylmethionine decarboxylase proenzyme
MKGRHLIAELYQCQAATPLLRDALLLRETCLDAVRHAGLTVVGDVFHQFEGGGVTGAVILAESHLAVHTWPEMHALSLDVYVCDYASHNGVKAQSLLDRLLALFSPGERVIREV